jgi:hypothetical protein
MPFLRSTTRRILRITPKAKVLRTPLVWLRHRGLGSSDVFMASYPRSGSTWLRFLLFEILAGQSGEFETIGRAIPYVGRHRRAPELLPNGGRLIKTHEPYREAYRKAVYLVRDVRDVVVSEHSYEKMRGYYDKNLDAFVADFLTGRVHGLGSWADHVNSWLGPGPTQGADVHVIKFEDMRQNIEGTIAGVLDFLGTSVDIGVIREAIRNNSIERMREKEDRAQIDKAKKYQHLRLVREGSIEGWRQTLTDHQVQLIERQAEETLARLEYQLAN